MLKHLAVNLSCNAQLPSPACLKLLKIYCTELKKTAFGTNLEHNRTQIFTVIDSSGVRVENPPGSLQTSVGLG